MHQFNALNELRESLGPELEAHGFLQHESYKDTIIGPPDNVRLGIDKGRLMSLADTCRVEPSGWGGAAFPYEKFPQTQEIRLPYGVRYVDTEAWPYSTWSFHFWQIDQDLLFFHRTDMEEDHAVNASGDRLLEHGLGYE